MTHKYIGAMATYLDLNTDVKFYGNATEQQSEYTVNMSGGLTTAGFDDCSSDPELSAEARRIQLIEQIGVYIIVICCIIVFAIGIIGEAVLMFIILRNKTMHHAPNVFIFSIALGDFVFVSVGTPFAIFIYALDEWPFGVLICKFFMFLQTLSMGVSIFTLTFMSWDRYTAIARPMEKQRNASLRKTCIHVVCLWVAAITLAIMDVVAANAEKHEHCGKIYSFCSAMPDSWGPGYKKFRTVLYLNIYFLLPLIAMAYFYISMARVLLKSTGMVERGDRFQKQLEARKRTVKIALSLVVLFLLCWLPRNVFQFSWEVLNVEFNTFWYFEKMLGFCLSFMSSCVNPIALYLLSRQYRHFYNRYLFCCCKCTEPMDRRARGSNYSTLQTALVTINSSDKQSFT